LLWDWETQRWALWCSWCYVGIEEGSTVGKVDQASNYSGHPERNESVLAVAPKPQGCNDVLGSSHYVLLWVLRVGEITCPSKKFNVAYRLDYGDVLVDDHADPQFVVVYIKGSETGFFCRCFCLPRENKHRNLHGSSSFGLHGPARREG